MTALPDNLKRLHQAEEELRRRSVAAVEADPHLATEMQAAHDALDHLTVLVGLPAVEGSDRHTLQLLALRSLNFVASALKVGMAGYYQVAFSLLRDLLETTNLVDLFLADSTLVSTWKNGDKATHNKLFRPVVVREALQNLPQHAGQNRQPKYGTFSTFAAHPNYAGFALLVGDNGPNMGPFFDLKKLKALLEDMGRLSSHLTLNLSIAIETEEDDAMEFFRAKAAFLERLAVYRRTW
jgi:hypothetical protein